MKTVGKGYFYILFNVLILSFNSVYANYLKVSVRDAQIIMTEIKNSNNSQIRYLTISLSLKCIKDQRDRNAENSPTEWHSCKIELDPMTKGYKGVLSLRFKCELFDDNCIFIRQMFEEDISPVE